MVYRILDNLPELDFPLGQYNAELDSEWINCKLKEHQLV